MRDYIDIMIIRAHDQREAYNTFEECERGNKGGEENTKSTYPNKYA